MSAALMVMDWEALGDLVVRSGAIVAAISTIVMAIYGLLWRLMKQLREEIHEIVRDETVELRPNHGSSIKDEVSLISERLGRVEQQHRTIMHCVADCPQKGRRDGL